MKTVFDVARGRAAVPVSGVAVIAGLPGAYQHSVSADGETLVVGQVEPGVAAGAEETRGEDCAGGAIADEGAVGVAARSIGGEEGEA
jgi:hypothetical protein